MVRIGVHTTKSCSQNQYRSMGNAVTVTIPLLLGLLLTASVIGSKPPSEPAFTGYGVDCSFPVFDRDLSGCGDILGDRQSFYEEYMQGCRDHFGSKAHRCDTTEQDRLDMSRRQPQSMVVCCRFLMGCLLSPVRSVTRLS
jgi:hypothetical protein